jgi:adenylate cyclase
VGDGVHVTLTALGDAVNTAARLASAAEAGEILLTTAAARAAELDAELEQGPLEVKGKQEIVDVVSLRVSAPAATAG